MRSHYAVRLKKSAALCLVFFSIWVGISCESQQPQIHIWYGKKQKCGHNGIPQRWINILGRVNSHHGIDSVYSILNQKKLQALALGPDSRRLAHKGDFNSEYHYQDLKRGKNRIDVIAIDSTGKKMSKTIHLSFNPQSSSIPSYQIRWDSIKTVQDAVSVVDGLWAIDEKGIRIVEPYYDRAIAIGDTSWRDYEVTAKVIFHGMRIPQKNIDRGADVIHVAIALRWPGHGIDNHQPHTKWYPLGATAEFRIHPDWQRCSWRILGGKGKVAEEKSHRSIVPEKAYMIKHQVKTVDTGQSRYRVKLWDVAKPEPVNWDLEYVEDSSDVQNGGALLIAHYSDVTFGQISVSSPDITINTDKQEQMCLP